MVKNLMSAYIICTSSRSGSSYLGSLLDSYSLGKAKEIYSESVTKQDFIENHTVPYLNGAIWSLKVKDNNLKEGRHFTCSKPGSYAFNIHPNGDMPNLKYIRLIRLNKLAQAISQYVLTQTEQSTRFENTTKVETSNIPYNFDKIYKTIEYKKRYGQRWDRFFENIDLVPLTIFYEELIENETAVIQQISDFIGIKPTEKNAKVRIPILQRDEKSIEFTHQFKLDCTRKGIYLLGDS